MEEKLSEITKRPAIAVANGGAALEIALAYKRLTTQGKVIVPVNTFAATALAVERAGFEICFADSDSKYMGLNFFKAKEMIESDPFICGVIVVHIGGLIDPDIVDFVAWCQKKGIFVLEDSAHAIGSELENRHAGTFGYAGTFSFFATKTVGSAEGGAIITDDHNLIEFTNVYKNYGKAEKWKHEIIYKGWNYRISELSSAVIYVQLKYLRYNLETRKRLVELYYQELKDDFDFILPDYRQNSNSWYKLIIATGVAGRIYYEKMLENGVKLPGTVFDPPLNEMKVFRFRDKSFNEGLVKTHICLPLYPSLSYNDIEYVIKALKSVHREIKKEI